jgi:hypothetical protein
VALGLPRVPSCRTENLYSRQAENRLVVGARSATSHRSGSLPSTTFRCAWRRRWRRCCKCIAPPIALSPRSPSFSCASATVCGASLPSGRAASREPHLYVGRATCGGAPYALREARGGDAVQPPPLQPRCRAAARTRSAQQEPRAQQCCAEAHWRVWTIGRTFCE